MNIQSEPPRLDRLQYIEAMLAQLREMAETEQCDMLTYMIEMAYIECADITRGRRPPRIMPSINRID